MSVRYHEQVLDIRQTRLTLLVILFIAFVLRVLPITRESLWRDEIDIIRFSQAPWAELAANFGRVGFNGPLYLLLVRGWGALVGTGDFSLRYFSLGSGVLLMAVFFLIGSRLFNRQVGVVAAWLLAVAPVHIWYSGEGKMYALQSLLLALALYALLKSHTGKWLAIFLACTAAAFYVHILSPVFLLVMLAFFLIRTRPNKTQLKRTLLVLALVAFLYLPLLVWQVPVFAQGGGTGHTFYSLGAMAVQLLGDWSTGFGAHAPLFFWRTQPSGVRLIFMSVFVALAVYGGLVCVRTLRRSLLITLAWLGLPTLAVYAISLRAPVFEPRYLLWCAPAFYLLLAQGICASSRFSVPVIFVCTSISLGGVFAQLQTPIRPDIRGAAAYLQMQMQPSDVLVFQIPYGQHAFAYYLPVSQQRVVEAPYTNYAVTEADVYTELNRLALFNQRVWLIETETAMWDARGLVRRWFDETLPVQSRQEFHGVTLSLHKRKLALNQRLYLPAVGTSKTL